MTFEAKYVYKYKDCPYNNPKGARKRDVAKIYKAHKKLHWEKALSIQEIYRRIHRGWSIEDVVTISSMWQGGNRRWEFKNNFRL